MAVEFTDNSIKVKAALDDAAIAFLYEIGGEAEAQVKRNVPPGQWYAQQKNNWTYKVDESKHEAIIGNPMQQSLWTEYGTGEFALHGDGRKGYWVYVKGSDGSESSHGGKSYTLSEAKRIVAMMRGDGLDAHYTKGQEAKRPLFKALESIKGVIEARAKTIFSGRMN
jgi:hypothetical protein